MDVYFYLLLFLQNSIEVQVLVTLVTCRQLYSPVEVMTSQYWLPVLASRKPPGRERLAAN